MHFSHFLFQCTFPRIMFISLISFDNDDMKLSKRQVSVVLLICVLKFFLVSLDISSTKGEIDGLKDAGSWCW